jgi:PEGA domain
MTTRQKLTEAGFASWLVLIVFATTALSNSHAQTSPQSENVPQKVRVYVTDSQSWEMIGGWGLSGTRNANGSGSISGGGYEAGGARPQTAEIIKTFNQRCPEITITNNVQRADFAVTLDHEGGKGYLRHRNKIVVFNREGDDIFSDSTRELGSSVADACTAIRADVVKADPAASVGPQTQPTTAPRPDTSVSGGTAIQPTNNAQLEIASTPAGAEIQIDGNFVGNTPSTIGVSAGDHLIRIEKNGYEPWERKLKISTGKVNVNTELEPKANRDQKTETAVASTPPPLSAPSAPPAPPHDTTAPPSEILVTIDITSEPVGADIYIDDAETGLTPMIVKLKPGKHAFRMFMTGYDNWVQWLPIQAGPDVHVTATLEKSN